MGTLDRTHYNYKCDAENEELRQAQSAAAPFSLGPAAKTESRMPKVLIATPALRGLEGPFQEVFRAAGYEVVYPQLSRQLYEEELIPELEGITACIAGSEPYTRRVLEASPALRVIARNGVGYDAVDCAAATELGVAVTIAPGANHESVAEHTFALLLAAARSVVPQHDSIREGRFQRDIGVPLRERTLGLVGLGRIGREVALRAAAFRMRILAHEPYPDPAFVEQHGIQLVSVEQLLAESDFVSLHIPMSAGARHLINAQTLALMKPTAFLINTARGGLINEADLAAALDAGRLAGAGLDVFSAEPPPADHPLIRHPRVVNTAHTAGIDAQALQDMALLAAQSIVGLCRGGWPEAQVVNPEVRGKVRPGV